MCMTRLNNIDAPDAEGIGYKVLRNTVTYGLVSPLKYTHWELGEEVEATNPGTSGIYIFLDRFSAENFKSCGLLRSNLTKIYRVKWRHLYYLGYDGPNGLDTNGPTITVKYCTLLEELPS